MNHQYILDLFELPYAGVYAVAIFVTIIALVISTRYTLKNLLAVKSGTETQTDQVEDEITKGENKSTRSHHSEDTENEGDDEVEGDDNEADPSPTLSPRYPDPVDYCEHIQGEIKRVQQKVATKSIAETLTEDQLQEEREVQRKQLAEIFRLMQEQEDRFGIGTMDDMQEQMKLYAV